MMRTKAMLERRGDGRCFRFLAQEKQWAFRVRSNDHKSVEVDKFSFIHLG